MPTNDPSEGFSGLQEWSEPLIYDRLNSAYQKLLTDEALSRTLTRVHAQAWRSLIRGDVRGFQSLRAALVPAVEQSRLSRNDLADVDAEIMVELLEVVISRYNRSHRTARSYHLALMQLAGQLAPTRLAA